MANTQTAVQKSNPRQFTSESRSTDLQLGRDVLEYLRGYRHERPEAQRFGTLESASYWVGD